MGKKFVKLLAFLTAVASVVWLFRDFPEKPLENLTVKMFNPLFFLLALVPAALLATIFVAIHLYNKYKDKEQEAADDEMWLTNHREKQAKTIVLLVSWCTLGSGYLLYLALRYLFNEMAKKDDLVTFRADGEIKAIMRGDTCVKYLMKVENHRIDPDGFDIFKGSLKSYTARLFEDRKKKLQEDPGFTERKLELDKTGNLSLDEAGHCQLKEGLREAIIKANSTTLFEELFGVYWVGFSPYNVFKYQFRWLKFGQKKAENGVPSKDVEVHAREERVDSLYFRYPQYAVSFKDLETGAGELGKSVEENGKFVVVKSTVVQVKGTLVFETVTKNPHKTLFRTAALSSAGDWQQALVREILDRFRKWLGTTNWDELVKEQDIVREKLEWIAAEINKDVAIKDYGQEIARITMPAVDLEDTRLQDAYNKILEAEKKRDANIAEAAGKRALAAADIKGKADGLAEISKIKGGQEMYTAEQLGKLQGFYAPGQDKVFFNVATKVTGRHTQPSEEPEDSQETDKK